MDSGRRSFVGSLMAFLLAPMAVGGCLLPRRKSRRLAGSAVLIIKSRMWWPSNQMYQECITVYGSGDVLKVFEGYCPDQDNEWHSRWSDDRVSSFRVGNNGIDGPAYRFSYLESSKLKQGVLEYIDAATEQLRSAGATVQRIDPVS